MSTPAFLIVIGKVTDREQMAQYKAALREAGLYARHGGRYLAVGRAVAGLENWDEGTGIVVAQFPDAAAAQAFWDSEEYQQTIKPLRATAGHFQVAILPGVAG